MVKPLTKFQVSMFNHYDERQRKMYMLGWFGELGVAKGHHYVE